MAAAIIAEIRASKKPYYVYVLCKPDGTPFYVGKGRKSDKALGQRIFGHEREARLTNKRTPKLCAIRKIYRDGGSIQYRIASWHKSDAAACRAEIALIAKYGRKDLGTGVLCNCTSGGDTPTIGPHSRKRMSEAQKKYFANDAARRKTSEATRAAMALVEVRQRIRDGLANVDHETQRARMSRSRRAYLAAHPESTARHSESLKKRWRDDPAGLEALTKRRARSLGKPDVRRKMSEANKRWRELNPEAAAIRDTKGAEKRRTPEYRRRNAENTRRVAALRASLRNECEELVAICGAAIALPEYRAAIADWTRCVEQLRSLAIKKGQTCQP